MSQEFEHIFKEALQNQEVPYNPKAWESLSARLDNGVPHSGKKSFGPKAATFLAIGILGAASVLYLYPSSEKTTAEKTKTTEKTTMQTTNDNDASSISSNQKSDEITQPVKNSNRANVELSETTTTKFTNVNASVNYRGVGNAQGNPAKNGQKIDVNNELPNMSGEVQPPRKPYENTSPVPSDAKLNVQLPQISNLCQFMDKSIVNSSDVAVQVEFPSGKTITVPSHQSKTVALEEAGKYIVSNTHGRENSFVVYQNTPIDFTIDQDHLYKNGVPTTEVKLTRGATNGEWTSTFGNQHYSGSKAEFHFFKKGDYKINVTATNEYGCAAATSKMITIEDDYKLLATTAFKPQEIDPRLNTFMPLGLKERNTKFRLVIFDPKDGATIYETTDADAGWDGIDKRNGKPADHGANFIWKVTLDKPMAGEANDYKGIVTVIVD